MEIDLQTVLTEQNVAKDNAQKLIEAYGAPFTEAGAILADFDKESGKFFNLEVTDEDQTDLMAEAREKRLALKKVRTGVENRRVELKADYLVITKAIDGVAKYIRDEIEPAEKYLELQEKFGEIKAAERAAALKAERIEKLSVYTNYVHAYSLDTMDEPSFNGLLSQLKDAHEAKLAKAEADRIAAEKAEKKRLAAEKKMREENARLKREADEREARLAKEREAERQKQAAEQKKRDEELAAERAKLDEERKKREELEREQREKAAEEHRLAEERAAADWKAQIEKDEADRQALLAPDKEKLLKFAEAIELIRTEKLPAVKTNQAQFVVTQIDDMLKSIYGMIAEQAEKL